MKPVSQPPRSVAGAPLAGVGTADITPTPGFWTGGYGPAGATSRGHWTRLKARAFYFRDSRGQGLMVISVDTFAVSARLHADLAELLGFEPQSLIIAATHTHHGPGNFLSASLYNVFGSGVSGHSARLEQHLRDGMLKAAQAAVAGALPGRRVRLLTGSLSDKIQLNRSPWIFTLNHDRQDLLRELDSRASFQVQCPAMPPPGEPKTGWDMSGCPRLRAVNRRVHLLQILESDGKVSGMAVFLAVHPTVLAPDAPFFSADLFGVAGRELERAFSSDRGKPVVAFFNGAEGDVVTRRRRRDIRDVVTLGQTLAAEIDSIARHPQTETAIANTRIDTRWMLVNWRIQPPGETPRLASPPMPGAAALGGAEGDRTHMYDLGFREGVRRNSSGEHGVKQPALDLPGLPPILTRLVAPRWAYPPRLPVTVALLDGVTIVTLPFEASTATGLHIERAVANALPSAGNILIVGLANEYASYMATADEYEGQDYMGASTLWGPQQSMYFEGIAGKLASSTTAPTVGAFRRFFAGGSVGLGPHRVGDHRLVPDATLERVVQNDDGLPARDLPQFIWLENYDGESSALELIGQRRVQVVRDDGTVVDDDTGYRLLTLLAEAPRNRRARWNAVWLGPLWGPRHGRYYFKVIVGNGASQCSELFAFRPDTRTVLEVRPCP